MQGFMRHHGSSKAQGLNFLQTLSTDTPDPGVGWSDRAVYWSGMDGLMRFVLFIAMRTVVFTDLVMDFDEAILFVARYHSVEPNVSTHAA